MIKSERIRGVLQCLQATEVNNQDRYKSYIQKRRVGSDSSEDNFSAEIKSEKSPLSNIEDLSLYKENKTYEGFSRASSFNDHTSYRNQRFRPIPDHLSSWRIKTGRILTRLQSIFKSAKVFKPHRYKYLSERASCLLRNVPPYSN